MPNTNLGKVVITPKGEYSALNTYHKLDAVHYNGNSYLATQTVIGEAPSESNKYVLLASKGDEGKNAYQYAVEGGFTGTESEFSKQIASLNELDRRVTQLESGVIAGFETDSTVAYQKKVPANALLYAELEKSGVSTIYRKSTNLLPINEYTLNAPFEVGVKKEICTVELPAGMYYISFEGYVGGNPIPSDGDARIIINDIDSRYITLDNAETVTVYAVTYLDYTQGGFYSIDFTQIGIFAVSGEQELPSYEEYVEPAVYSAPLIAINSNDNIYTIPASMVELQETMVCGDGGYGYDYIDWANKKLYKCMKTVDMGALEWTYLAKTFRSSPENMKAVSENIGIFCEGYSYLGFTGTGGITLTELGCANSASGQIRIKDSNFTSAEEFKSAIAGKMLSYELAEPEVIDIDTGNFDRFIEVSPDGTITFVNANNAAIPSTITYQLEEE